MPDAFEEDCARAAVVVTPRQASPNCAALTIGRDVSRAAGAVALWANGDGWKVQAARPPGQDRPWAPAVATSQKAAAARSGVRPVMPDATPRAEDLEAGD
jgi:competence protein ComEC